MQKAINLAKLPLADSGLQPQDHLFMTGSICDLGEVCLQICMHCVSKEITLVMKLLVVCVIAADYFFLRFIYLV